jgi:hypothetical protein
VTTICDVVEVDVVIVVCDAAGGDGAEVMRVTGQELLQ